MASEHLLGISAFYHDSAACLLAGDSIVAAAQEERFTRVNGDERLILKLRAGVESIPKKAAEFIFARAKPAAHSLKADRPRQVVFSL